MQNSHYTGYTKNKMEGVLNVVIHLFSFVRHRLAVLQIHHQGADGCLTAGERRLLVMRGL